MPMQERKSIVLAVVALASTLYGCAAREDVDPTSGPAENGNANDESANDARANVDVFERVLGQIAHTPTPRPRPTPNPPGDSPAAGMGTFKVCNTGSDGCICNAADNCTTNGITYNTQKPPRESKKVILYFHGHNGSSSLCDSKRENQQTQFLANMYKEGFGWICADSSDRVEKWWSVVNSSSNPDVVNLEQILAKEGYDATAQIYMIGHSNGGGFVSQMNTYTKLKNIRAVAFAHSAAAGGGGSSEVCDRSWITPAFITGSDKDTVVPWSSLLKMFDCLQSKGVPTQLDNDAALQPPGSNHNFLDRSDLIAPFWSEVSP